MNGHNPSAATDLTDPIPVEASADVASTTLISFRERKWIIPPEYLPDVDKIVIDDGAFVDNIFAERQQRLLTDALESSWAGPGEGRVFAAFANVGLFFKYGGDPLVPDVMVALDQVPGEDLSIKDNRSFFTWVVCKPPNIVIELISDLRGKEDTRKLVQYGAVGVPYYAIYDPMQKLGGEALEVYGGL